MHSSSVLYGAGVVSVVGVHGIGQGRKSAQILAKEWTRAVQLGLRAEDPSVPVPQIVVPHLSPLLHAKWGTLGPSDDAADPASWSPDEISFIESGLADLLADLDEGQVDQLVFEATTLGLRAFPTARGLRLLTAVDGRWRGGGRTALMVLREVHAYLNLPAVGEQVRRRVRKAAGEGTRVMIGHSLGSVVAYDVIRRGQMSQVATFVTCGSPLAWPTVRNALAIDRSSGGAAQLASLPEVRWTNVHDPHDAVTGGWGLQGLWPEVTDHDVNNPIADAHGASGYLAQGHLARALIEGLGW